MILISEQWQVTVLYFDRYQKKEMDFIKKICKICPTNIALQKYFRQFTWQIKNALYGSCSIIRTSLSIMLRIPLHKGWLTRRDVITFERLRYSDYLPATLPRKLSSFRSLHRRTRPDIQDSNARALNGKFQCIPVWCAYAHNIQYFTFDGLLASGHLTVLDRTFHFPLLAFAKRAVVHVPFFVVFESTAVRGFAKLFWLVTSLLVSVQRFLSRACSNPSYRDTSGNILLRHWFDPCIPASDTPSFGTVHHSNDIDMICNQFHSRKADFGPGDNYPLKFDRLLIAG